VAILSFGNGAGTTPAGTAPPATLIRERLAALGRVDGRSIRIADYYAHGDLQRLDQLAREIADSRPDVIVAIPLAATLAARRATGTIPIVMAHGGDPVGAGLATSLARPGGNVTGTTSMVPELGPKQFELLRQLLPRLSRLAVLMNPTNPGHVAQLATLSDAARPSGVGIVAVEVARAQDLDGALAAIERARPDALFVMVEPMITVHQARVLDFVRARRLPASFDVGREIVRQGGLISYGPVLSTHYVLVADYVHKILEGAKPADLPIQQPTEFKLVINLKTARELGLAIPQALLLRADEVVQ
jgi:putative ABC transport system substrate-binding protein